MKTLTWLAALAAALLAGCTEGPDGATETPTSRLCVVRHAQAYKNLDPRPAGMSPEQLDSLTPDGEAQARALAGALPDGVARLWSSPARRTRQTAERLGLPVPVRVEPALRPLEGDLPWDQRMAAWSRGEDPRPEGGESLADGAARADALLRRLRAELEPGEHAAVVTHGDLASILLGELRGTPLLERPRRDTLGTGQMRCLPLGADASAQASRTSKTGSRSSGISASSASVSRA
jgi:broad specificity phosphatase PhoE